MPETPVDLGEELARIQAEVEAGVTDLRGLGFWRLVERVKRDPAAAGALGERIAGVDRAAFDRAALVKVPVWLGNALLLGGIAAGLGFVLLAHRTTDPVVAGGLLLAACGAWVVCGHSLTHWVVGRLLGIRFTCYYLSTASWPPRPGVKIDYASYLRTGPRDRACMHASGALGSKVAPFIVMAAGVGSAAPWWAFAALGTVAIVTIVTDAVASTKKSDWKRVLRELRVARELESSR